MLEREHWPDLDGENQAELLAYLGRASCATSLYTPSISWVVTGVDSNDYNGVIWARLSPEEADQQVPALVEYFRNLGLPALWQLDRASQPQDLAQRLAAAGSRPLLPGVCMVAPLQRLPFQSPRVRGLTVERVTTPADLSAWMDVWAHGDEEARAPRERLYAALGLDDQQPLQHFLARIDGVPVGVSQIFLGQRAVGLYCVHVLPAFQRQGVGTALTLVPFQVAHGRGYEMAVLGPSPEGQPMYQRLGFELLPSPFMGYTLWRE